MGKFGEMGRRSVTYRKNMASAVQKRQNRSTCRLGHKRIVYWINVNIGATKQIRLKDCGLQWRYEWVWRQGRRRGLFPNYCGQCCKWLTITWWTIRQLSTSRDTSGAVQHGRVCGKTDYVYNEHVVRVNAYSYQWWWWWWFQEPPDYSLELSSSTLKQNIGTLSLFDRQQHTIKSH